MHSSISLLPQLKRINQHHRGVTIALCDTKQPYNNNEIAIQLRNDNIVEYMVIIEILAGCKLLLSATFIYVYNVSDTKTEIGSI